MRRLSTHANKIFTKTHLKLQQKQLSISQTQHSNSIINSTSMAAVSSNAWGKPGAWALDAEENEAELLIQHKQDTTTKDFPSLSAAASTKTKKKKPQTVSLQQFTTTTKTTTYQPNKGLTHDEILSLPTAPRERSAVELDRTKLGGGFRSYGNGNTRDDQPRRNRDSDREFVPSRSDGVDNWASDKKPSFERKDRVERCGFFTDSQSRADEVDNWASKKSFVPSVEPRRYERRGGAFDSLTEKRGGGFETSESWGKNTSTEEGSGIVSGSRPKLNLQPRTKPVSEEAVHKPKGSSPFGDARPREEVLKEKGQDWKEIDEKLESVKIKDDNGWRKSEPGGSRVQSDADSGHVENTENCQAEETENGDVKI